MPNDNQYVTEDKPFGTSIEDTTIYTQSLRKSFVASLIDEDGDVKEDPELFLRVLNDIDRTVATKTKLSNDEDDNALSAQYKAQALETLLQIGTMRHIKDISNTEEFDSSDILPPSLPDDITVNITQNELSKGKTYDSLEDFDTKFANDFRDQQSQ